MLCGLIPFFKKYTCVGKTWKVSNAIISGGWITGDISVLGSSFSFFFCKQIFYN
jgi:hypothetical protein